MSEKPPVNNAGDGGDELRELWQQQSLEKENVPLEDIRKKAGKFESTIRWRNLREYVAAVIVIVAFGVLTYRASNIEGRLGAGLIVVAAIYITYVIYNRGSAQHVPEDAARLTYIQFHRLSLERQRDLLRNIWRWYLLPFVPGFGLLIFSAAVRDGVVMNPNRTSEQLRHGFVLLKFAAFQALVLVVIAALNKRAARKLQMKIDALDAEERGRE